jgi:hypothetical protein
VASLGTNVINIFGGGGGPGSVRTDASSSSRFFPEDVEAIRKESPALSHITPSIKRIQRLVATERLTQRKRAVNVLNCQLVSGLVSALISRRRDVIW